MSWIKRNLFFVIGAAIAVGLLAAAGVYGYQNWQRNNQALNDLHQEYATLRRLNAQNPSPGNDQINNIQAARQQEKELRQWIQQAGHYFQPISPVPDVTNGVISDAQFAAARDHTLSELQTEAVKDSITLPSQYAFSFDAERSLVKFAPNSLPALAQQLGEVEAICKILYAAKVNSLDDIRRVAVSADDAGGPQSDYLNQAVVTNNLAVFTPYVVTFRGFSQNLAEVLTSFATSPHAFIVTGIKVQPASSVTSTSSASGPTPSRFGQQPTSSSSYYYSQSYQRYRRYYSQNYYSQGSAVPSSASGSGGGLKTVLNEQLLSITLDIKIVRLLPGN